MNDIIRKFGLIKYLLLNNAKIASLEIDYSNDNILTSMNPSIWIDNDGTCYINIRAINYNLFTSRFREYTQGDQPLSYICKDEYTLHTHNYFGELNLSTLEIKNISKVEMLNIHEPKWMFQGLEDARIMKYDDNIYLCGVRRDIKENGEGRMELSKIEYLDGMWKETQRDRIPAAFDDSAYLEKNWMPIVNMPFTWLKWSNPVEICHYDFNTKQINITYNGNFSEFYRGDSQVIKIDKYYYCFAHTAINKQLRSETNSRITRYDHYILRLNEDLTPAGKFGPFRYDNRFNIEFGCGLATYNGKCYLTYAENDASSFIIEFDNKIITDFEYE